MLEALPFCEDTLLLLHELAGGHNKLAVVSSSGRTEVDPPLQRAGLSGCFQHVITCEDVENVKPHPEPYLLAARCLSARRPLVIEDSDSGAASAEAAGFDVLRVSGPKSMAAELRRHLASWPTKESASPCSAPLLMNGLRRLAEALDCLKRLELS